MDIELVKVRIDLIKDAIRRSRAAFLAATIASLALIITAWNAYLSSYRTFFPLKTLSADAGTREAQLQLIRAWVDSLWITIAPLGIRIGISDAAVLGAIGVYVIAVWMFFCVRRENRAVANFFYDMHNVKALELKELAQHAVSETMLFLNVKNDDEPLDTIDDIERSPRRKATLLRGSVRVLFYLPAIAVFFVLILDVASLFVISAVFRDPHYPLFVGIHHGSTTLSWPEFSQLAVMTLVELTLAIMTLVACLHIMSFENATTELIRENDRHNQDAAIRE